VTKGKETNLWAQVTPEMMSDEELEGNVYVRHQPSYRSDGLHAFIKKLDSRLETDNSNRWGRGAHPRLERRLGSPREIRAPELAKKWTIRKDHRPQHNGAELQDSNSQAHNQHLTIDAEQQSSDNQLIDAEDQDFNSLENDVTDGDSSPLEFSDSDSDLY
jgi:hypothetical protein